MEYEKANALCKSCLLSSPVGCAQCLLTGLRLGWPDGWPGGTESVPRLALLPDQFASLLSSAPCHPGAAWVFCSNPLLPGLET